MLKVILICIILLCAVGVFAADSNSTSSDTVTIALSSTAATGLTIGVGLIGLLCFSVSMMQGIQISDTMTDTAKESS